ncbi:glycosyltransferase [Plantibacter sp. Mn2098]|uniref:glycosyltransferase n=1 Tax=Plantibacter sp. Mn2098 TaxID=3395266 RepID=UPI003BEA505A
MDARPPAFLLAHPSADLYGSDRVFLETVAALSATGAPVTVTLPADGPLVPMLEAHGARVVFTPSLVLRKSLLSPRGLFTLIGHTVTGLRAGRRLVREVRPTLIWTNTITIPLWTLIAKLGRIPSVVHVHEAEGSASRLVTRALSFPLLFADRLVANSRYSVGVLRSAFARLEGRTTVVYNGVVGPDAVVSPRPVLTDGLRVVYVGRLSPRKGPDVAIAAIGELSKRGVDAHLDVVGAVFPGYEWFETELRELVSHLGLDDRIVLHGFQDAPWALLASGDVLVVPSRLDEPFGNTAVEGILAARPVIVSDTSGLREAAAGYASAQFVPPSDAVSLANALETVSNEWGVMSNAALNDEHLARARHSIETYRRRIVSVAEDLSAGAVARAQR